MKAWCWRQLMRLCLRVSTEGEEGGGRGESTIASSTPSKHSGTTKVTAFSNMYLVYSKISRLFQDRAHSLSTFYSTVEGATKLKFVPFCSPSDVLLPGIIFSQSQNFQILAKNHGL